MISLLGRQMTSRTFLPNKINTGISQIQTKCAITISLFQIISRLFDRLFSLINNDLFKLVGKRAPFFLFFVAMLTGYLVS